MNKIEKLVITDFDNTIIPWSGTGQLAQIIGVRRNEIGLAAKEASLRTQFLAGGPDEMRAGFEERLKLLNPSESDLKSASSACAKNLLITREDANRMRGKRGHLAIVSLNVRQMLEESAKLLGVDLDSAIAMRLRHQVNGDFEFDSTDPTTESLLYGRKPPVIAEFVRRTFRDPLRLIVLAGDSPDDILKDEVRSEMNEHGIWRSTTQIVSVSVPRGGKKGTNILPADFQTQTPQEFVKCISDLQ